MSSLCIRKSGGAKIISLPKAILDTLGLDVGSELDLSIQDDSILLTPTKDVEGLQDLLAGLGHFHTKLGYVNLPTYNIQ